MKPDLHQNSLFVKEQAYRLGFDFCGISEAGRLEEESGHLSTWLDKGYQGTMSYLEDHFEKRLDPALLVPGARSVISVLYNYYPVPLPEEGERYKIARYAYGRDYHKVIKKKLLKLFAALQEAFGPLNGRAFVDSAPVLERQWAARSGLGWIGKNGLLINKNMGSYFFIGELIVDLELAYDGPVKDYCGKCTRCLDACPTRAFVAPGVLDASKCISYLTIEMKEEIPEQLSGQYKEWIFGCDICQEVCPWNRFSKPHHDPAFEPRKELLSWKKEDWENMTEEAFKKMAEGTPLKRAKYEGMKKNIRFLSKKRPPV